MPHFLELNQKVLEIFLVLANPRGFCAVQPLVTKALQIWGACLKRHLPGCRRDPLLMQLESVALDEPLTLKCSIFITAPVCVRQRRNKEYENTAL